MVQAAPHHSLARRSSSIPRSQRIEALRRLDLRFIPSAEFRTLTRERLQAEAPSQLFRDEGLDPLAMEAPLLTPEAEQSLFRAWNFHKYSAQKLLSKLKATSTESAIRKVEQHWRDAQQAQSRIVQSNLRLVMGLAHKYARTPEDVDDLISEGNLILINAVDKFDYSRGYRFSTYATHAVQRHYFRLLQRRQKRRLKEVATTSEHLASVASPMEEDTEFDISMAREFIQRFDLCLTSREKKILEQRFGLRGDSSATLKTVAETIGLSKERVRQLQRSALDKLQALARELRLYPDACL